MGFVTTAQVLPRHKYSRNVCPSHARRVRASMGDEIEKQLQFPEVSRVLESFRNVRAGRVLEVGTGNEMQHAHSYIDGLSAKPWHDPDQFDWCNHLTSNWMQIAEELREVNSVPDLKSKASNAWNPAVVEAAKAYGPDWRTFPLQDRKWDAVNSKLFPKTVEILKDSGVPSVECFFARQAPESGISLHTDFCNFQITAHLALDAPLKESWIECGGIREYWENGNMLIFDTSFMHRTWNASTVNRDVLLIRFWHPELTLVERKTLQWIFDVIEDPELLKPRKQISDLAQGTRSSRRKPMKRSKQKKSSGKGFGR